MTIQVPSDRAPSAAPGPPAPGDAPAGGGRRLPSAAGRALGRIGAAILLIQFLVAVFAPAIARHDPLLPSGSPYEAPGLAHLLGTNDLGQDLFAQLVYGARISLGLGLLAALCAVGVGLGVALLAGYLRGGVDALLMRLVDITLAFPFLPLVVVVAAFLGRELWTTVLVVAAVMWARPARVLRSQVLKVREYQHVTAAQAMGSSDAHVLGRHILPRVAPLAAAQFVRTTNAAVLIEASLAFLGLGDPNGLSWGTMLFFAQSRNALLTDAWLWWLLPPGLALSAAILGFAFVGYAVEEWADPRLRIGSARPSRRTSRRLVSAEPAQPDPDVVLDIRDLCLCYATPAGPLRAVNGVSLSVGRGRVVGLVGESGSGKSSLAMGLLRLVRPPGYVAGGAALLDGRDLLGLPLAEVEQLRGRAISLIPQSSMNALNPAYTVQRQVAEAASLTRPGRAAQARATELLELVGIPRARHHAYPHELSGGMRQRVVIAMAIANEPSLLVADEPVTGLDVITQATILRLILDLRARLGLALLLISHDLPLVGRVADDLLVMYAGRIVERGRTHEVVTDPRHPYTAALLRAFPSVHGPRRPAAALGGEPPDLARPPTGCRFHPRCPSVFEACRWVDPPEFEPRPGHHTRCLLEQA